MATKYSTEFDREIKAARLIRSRSKSGKGYTREFDLACGHREYATGSARIPASGILECTTCWMVAVRARHTKPEAN